VHLSFFGEYFLFDNLAQFNMQPAPQDMNEQPVFAPTPSPDEQADSSVGDAPDDML